MTREMFLADRKTQDAVVRSIEVIGEATKNLSRKLRTANPDVPWRDIAGMRDRIIHRYFDVNLAMVWSVVETDVPNLRAKVQQLLQGPSASAADTPP